MFSVWCWWSIWRRELVVVVRCVITIYVFMDYFYHNNIIKFIYSEKATKFCEIFTLLLTTVHTVKCKVNVLQNFVAISDYANFTMVCYIILSFVLRYIYWPSTQSLIVPFLSFLFMYSSGFATFFLYFLIKYRWNHSYEIVSLFNSLFMSNVYSTGF